MEEEFTRLWYYRKARVRNAQKVVPTYWHGTKGDAEYLDT